MNRFVSISASITDGVEIIVAIDHIGRAWFTTQKIGGGEFHEWTQLPNHPYNQPNEEGI